MKILHLLVAGNTGGIESLLADYDKYSKHENHYVFAWSGGKIEEEIRLRGSSTYILDKEKNGSSYVIREVLRICKEQNIEAVVAHHAAPFLRIVAAIAKIRIKGLKIFLYAHSNAFDLCDGNRPKGLFIRKLIYRTTFKMSDGVIAISDSVKDSLIDYLSVDKDKITVIYNGTEVTKFQKEKSEAGDRIKITYVGRLIEEKGVQITLKAISKMTGDNFVFRVVGDGPYRQDLEKLAKDFQIENKVEFLGLRNDVPDILSDSQIFVHMPEWEEGFGIAVIEAMAAGNICVVADSGAMPEIITDNVNGYLIKKGDFESLSIKLMKLIEEYSNVNIRVIEKNAKKRAMDFSIETFSSMLDNTMEK